MLSLPWAMAGASILVGAVIIVLLVGVVAPCGTSNVHDCIGAYWCILVHIGALQACNVALFYKSQRLLHVLLIFSDF